MGGAEDGAASSSVPQAPAVAPTAATQQAAYAVPPQGYLPQAQYAPQYQQYPPQHYQQYPPQYVQPTGQYYYQAQPQQQAFGQQAYAQQTYAQQPQAGRAQRKPPGTFGVQGGYDLEAASAAASAAAFAERTVRTAFMRKVLLLVALQIAITTGVACVFMFVKPLKHYVAGDSGRWVFIVALVLVLVMFVSLACSTTLRRRWPYNLVALFGFTAVMSILIGAICAYGNVQIVLIAFLTTAGVVATVTLLAFVIPFDMTKRGHILGAAAMMFFVAILITLLLGFFYANKWWFLVISCIGALLFSFFLLYDLQMVIGGKKYAISPDEYVFASVQIYMDIIQIFLFVLTIGSIASN